MYSFLKKFSIFLKINRDEASIQVMVVCGRNWVHSKLFHKISNFDKMNHFVVAQNFKDF